MDQEVREAELKQATADTLAAENAQLRAELDAMKQNQTKAAAVVEADEIRGMTPSRNATTIIIPHQAFKNEKISPTTRVDQGYDPSQRFNGRQP